MDFIHINDPFSQYQHLLCKTRKTDQSAREQMYKKTLQALTNMVRLYCFHTILSGQNGQYIFSHITLRLKIFKL
ncbi:MAG: hypothetical protein B1H11_03665 [Desulfobacteraceae bacterium 4484_190.1]|nr:MAG: hypothetical protein B1H11_03665 [Desulfobacteraceae bacterium 4484_190.1]